MKRKLTPVLALLLLALLFTFVAGCGGGSSSNSVSDSTAASTGDGTSEATQADEGSAHAAGTEADQVAVIAEFEVPGGKKQEINQILAAGTEASASEREAASQVLEENLDAREAKDWPGQCETLSKHMVNVVEESGIIVGRKVKCKDELEKVGKEAPPEALENIMKEPISVLRLISKTQAFAFFHGTDGQAHIIPLEYEGGQWKVASLTSQIAR